MFKAALSPKYLEELRSQGLCFSQRSCPGPSRYKDSGALGERLQAFCWV